MSRRSLLVLLGLLVLLASGFALLWKVTRSPAQVVADGGAPASGPALVESSAAAPLVEPAPEAPAPERELVERAQVAKAARPAALTPYEAELAAAQWVEGRVLLPDGTPPDEKLVVEARGKKFSNDALHSVAVGRDGAFRVAFSKDTKAGWLRLKGRYVFLSEDVKVKLPLKKGAEGNQAYELAPVLGGAIRARLVLPPAAAASGATIAGTRVQVWCNTYDSNDDGGRQRSLAGEVGPDELAEIGGVPAKGGWMLMLDPESFARLQHGDISVSAGKITDVELRLKLGARLEGKLLDDVGQPVEGASFTYHALNSTDGGWTNFHDKKSAADGAFDLRGTPTGKGTLTVEKEGFLIEERAFESLAEGDARGGLQLVLRRGHTIAGLVQGSAGQPLAGVQVTLRHPIQRGQGEAHWTDWNEQLRKSDAEGRFRFTGLQPEAKATLRAESKTAPPGEDTGAKAVEAAAAPESDSAPEEEEAAEEAKASQKPASKADKRRRWTAFVEDVPAGSQNVVLVLNAGYSVQGRVLDSSRAPVKDFLVRAEPVEKSREEWRPVRGAVVRRFSDPDGRFTVEGLHEGEWRLVAEAKNAPPSGAHQVRVPGTAPALELVLAPAASLAGVVLDPLGQPARGARVRAEIDHEQNRSFAIVGDKKYSDSTDAEGKFAIGGVPAGPLKLRATSDAWSSSEGLALDVAAGQNLAELRLVLRRPGGIAGQVLDDAGHADAKRTISLGGSENGYQQTTSDAEGRFRFEKVAPGEYYLHTQANQAELQAAEGDQERVSEIWREKQRSVRVKVEEGSVVEVTLGGLPKHAIHLTGRITCAGKPLAGCSVNAWKHRNTEGGDNQFHASSGPDGAYDLVLDGEGSYTLQISPSRSGTTQSFQHELGAQPSQVRDFELASSSISGRVVDAQGKPRGEIWLELQADTTRRGGGARASSGNTSTDEEGRFRFEYLPPGTYELSCGGDGGWRPGPSMGRSTLGGLVLESGKSLEGLELVLQPACRLEGSVSGPDGAPLAGASVVAVDETGRSLVGWGRQTTDAAGHFEFDALPPGRTGIAAYKGQLCSGFSTWLQVREGEVSKADLVLANGTLLYVEVVDAEDKPLSADIQVFDARGIDPSVIGGWDVHPAQELPGQRIGPLAPGKYTVVVMSKDAPDVRQEVSLSGEATRALRVRRE